MNPRLLSALTVGMVLGAGGTVATRDGSIAGAINGADVELHEGRVQFLADGGCSTYVVARHTPDGGVVATHRAREYPLSAAVCVNMKSRCVAMDAGCHEVRAQFLADAGCSLYSVSVMGEQSPEVGMGNGFCDAAKTRAAKAAMRDFEKSSEDP